MSKKAFSENACEVSKQAINAKFSTKSRYFVKKILDETISVEIAKISEKSALENFNSVKIKDSTIIELDESLASEFEGFGKNGGPNSKSAMRVQFEFDIKTDKINDLSLHSATERDSIDVINKQNFVEKDDLIIRDLGYYSQTVIDSIVEKQAFFVSKLYPNVAVRRNVNDKEKIDFEKLRQQMIQTNQTQLDIEVYIGKTKKPVRIILVLMPQDIYEKRIREKNKANKSTGYKTSDEYKSRAYFNIFITNVPRNILSTNQVTDLYRIRWQIELIFKTWKSILRVDTLRKMQIHRFMTVIYAKLLWIVLNWRLFARCRTEFYRLTTKLLSIHKSFLTLHENSKTLREIIKADKNTAQNLLQELILQFGQKHWVEKRKNKPKLEEIYDIIFCQLDN